jgi:hypothetical protein
MGKGDSRSPVIVNEKPEPLVAASIRAAAPLSRNPQSAAMGFFAHRTVMKRIAAATIAICRPANH